MLRDVGERRGHHRGTGSRKSLVQKVQIGQRLIEKQSRPGDVVHADADGDQVRPHRQGRRQLVVEHIANPAPADGEVGVLKAGVV